MNSINSKNTKNKSDRVEATNSKLQIRANKREDFESILYQSELYEHRFRDANQFTVDCSKSTTGLFFGIFILLITIISLITYFIYKKHYPLYAEVIAGISELSLICLSIVVVIASWIKLKSHKFRHLVREAKKSYINFKDHILFISNILNLN